MAQRIFGEIPGVPPGADWESRKEVAASGVHRPLMAGISGTGADGADSIVVSGGYEDDEDLGDVIIYTGAGGNDTSTKRQVADQTLEHPNNAGLVTSHLEGLPVRVVRGAHKGTAYAPVSGFRYDGLFRVAEHWLERGKSGFIVVRFLLLQLDDGEAAPYVPTQNLPAGQKRPGTSTGIVTRIIRSTAVSRAVKELHDHRCQVCGWRLEVPGGSVSEGAHIRALGKPHHGPDVPTNVLCLCPNHHAAFDQGGFVVDGDFNIIDHQGSNLGRLRTVPGHNVDTEQLAYHAALWAPPSTAS